MATSTATQPQTITVAALTSYLDDCLNDTREDHQLTSPDHRHKRTQLEAKMSTLRQMRSDLTKRRIWG